MDGDEVLKAMENEKALEVLAGCVGVALTGYGAERGVLTLRFASGERVRLHVAMCDELVEEIADVVSAFGRFIGGELCAVDGRDVCLRGIGQVVLHLE
jgi:hypothetical protein